MRIAPVFSVSPWLERRGKVPEAFLVHWNEAEAREQAEALQAAGRTVAVEWEGGARAWRTVKEQMPSVVIIDLSRLPPTAVEPPRRYSRPSPPETSPSYSWAPATRSKWTRPGPLLPGQSS